MMKILKSKMKKNKYFIVSDIHSYLDELVNALSATEFELDNPNHILIINGDVFDRGHQTVALYKWLKEFPQDSSGLVIKFIGTAVLRQFRYLYIKVIFWKKRNVTSSVREICIMIKWIYRQMPWLLPQTAVLLTQTLSE